MTHSILLKPRSKHYSVWHSESEASSPIQNDKLIVIWRKWGGRRLTGVQKGRFYCPSMPECVVTGNISQLDKADAVLFHDLPKVYSKRVMPQIRPPHQYWVWVIGECPNNPNVIDLVSYSGVFNWTMTYRNDSDVLINYGSVSLIYKRLAKMDISPDKDYTVGKKYLVVWFVSNCYKYLPRFIYATELVKHISVDVFGKCGKLVCLGHGKDQYNCSDQVIKQYKFYLSFESYKCKEYITEKFWRNAIANEVVPVVLGAPKADYEKFAPPGSFIHVDDFETPKDLADYLKILDKDIEKYNEYFRWRTQPPKSIYPDDYGGWCNLCRKLQQVNPTERKVYTDLDRWFAGENYEFCEPVVQVSHHSHHVNIRINRWAPLHHVP
ncbi:PREDICTED: alpha-(1,3)-fucosyltransferase 5-like [Branchiostoma belcheri]|uniref:Fucosyltransferase n=1 Tax=Branchiostoma belcheri TaxID=7741 RepID=A0A6P4XLD3_BRABE|nr:PREDICTED: alpha-(1,3)-fucosyltransferase 5-like [Branchiostoma belcheri]